MCKIIQLFGIFLYLLFSFSCLFQKEGYNDDDRKYINNNDYKNLYVVDTIHIENPVRIYSKSRNQFVMSKNTLKLYNGNDKFFFTRQDVFLLEDNLPMSLPSEIYEKYTNGDDCFEHMVFYSKKGIYPYYIFSRQPDFFLLVLVRGDYFNDVYAGIDGPRPLNFKKNKFAYYRLAIPFCLARIK